MEPLHRLEIDRPSPGSVVGSRCRIYGWAVVDGMPAKVRFLVDGRPTAAQVWTTHRPDLAVVLGLPDDIRYGYVAWVRLPNVGPTVVTAVVDTPAGPLARGLDVRSLGQIVELHLDRPGPRPVAADVLELEGWAFGRRAPVVSVRIEGDGIDRAATLGLPRLDVTGRGAETVPGRFGWSATVALPDQDVVPLVVIAEDAGGYEEALDVTVRRTSGFEPVLELERIALGDRHVDLEGYVLWPAPAPVSATVTAAVGGEVLAEGIADIARPDVARRFPGSAAAVCCGFTVTCPRPADGTVVVRVTDDDGRTVTASVAVERAAPRRRPVVVPPIEQLRDEVVAGGSLLDWDVGVTHGTVPATVLRPATASATLPYLDDTVDVVVLPSGVGSRLAEARRVARHRVLITRADGSGYDVERLSAGRPRPSVSVVIPVYGQDVATDTCLRSVLGDEELGDLDLEVVVVDDASPSRSTRRLLDRWNRRDPRVKPLLLEENHGYLLAVNRGVQASSGEVVVLLNNDTEPQRGWLHALLDVLERRPRTGVVGAKLVYPDGTLQDAGSIVFSGGTGWNYGRESPTPNAPQFSFLRRVDYCSAAGLATPRRVWDEVGGFDERFAPAYYEDTDYSFAVRAAGYEVVIQPAATIVHHEGKSHGTDEKVGIKAYQASNREKFVEKWSSVLAAHPPHPAPVTAKVVRELLMAGRER